MEMYNDAIGVPRPVAAYSQAIKSGGLIFCSGQIGISAESGKLVEGGVDKEIEQVLINLERVLKHTGSSVNKIVSVTIFLTTMSDFKVVNEKYQSFVSSELPPARQTVAVKELPMGAKVEISLIAEA